MLLTPWSPPESLKDSSETQWTTSTAMIKTSSIEEKLRSVAGPENLRAATASDAVSRVLPQFVAEPDNEQQLARILSTANEAGIAVIPRGGATKLDWGNPPKRAELILSTVRLNKILEHVWADLTVTVEAGCTLLSLQKTLAQHGQRLAFDGLWPERATIGGVLSTNDSGALRLRFGALRDLILGVTLALPDGTLASSGGKVVKNVAGYDLPKLATGALGTLGVIARAVFRLHPLPRTASTISCLADRISKVEHLIAQLLDSKLAYSALQTRFPDIEKPEVFIDVLFEGTPPGITAQIAHLQSLASPMSFAETNNTVWKATEHLYSQIVGNETFSMLLKMSALPADAIPAIGNLTSIAVSRARFRAVVQATGLGTILLTGDKKEVCAVATAFRKRMEDAGGSMVALGPSLPPGEFDAWGNPGDVLSLMRSVKHQLDPKNTLNPGRFVGGI
jgi:glycolate oxidase FAD binding subunit